MPVSWPRHCEKVCWLVPHAAGAARGRATRRAAWSGCADEEGGVERLRRRGARQLRLRPAAARGRCVNQFNCGDAPVASVVAVARLAAARLVHLDQVEGVRVVLVGRGLRGQRALGAVRPHGRTRLLCEQPDRAIGSQRAVGAGVGVGVVDRGVVTGRVVGVGTAGHVMLGIVGVGGGVAHRVFYGGGLALAAQSIDRGALMRLPEALDRHGLAGVIGELRHVGGRRISVGDSGHAPLRVVAEQPLVAHPRGDGHEQRPAVAKRRRDGVGRPGAQRARHQ